MKQQTFYFDEQSLIIAYHNDIFAGLVLAYAGETFTKTELLGFFEGTNPTYLISANLPDVGMLTPGNYQSKLTNLITELCENNQSNLDVNYYIPTTLH